MHDQPKFNNFEKIPVNLTRKNDKSKGLRSRFRVIRRKQRSDNTSQKEKAIVKSSTYDLIGQQ